MNDNGRPDEGAPVGACVRVASQRSYSLSLPNVPFSCEQASNASLIVSCNGEFDVEV